MRAMRFLIKSNRLSQVLLLTYCKEGMYRSIMRRLYLSPVILLLLEAFLASVPAGNAFRPVTTLNVPPLISAAIDGVTTCPSERITYCGYAYFGTTTGT